MNALNLVKKSYEKVLRKSLENASFDVNKDQCIIVGAGVSGVNFVKNNPFLKIKYIVDTRPIKIGSVVDGKNVVSEVVLLGEDRSTFILIAAFPPFAQKFKAHLFSEGFNNVIIPNIIMSGSLSLFIKQNKILDFFKWLNQNKIRYVSLRRPGRSMFLGVSDVDILVDSKHIVSVLEAPMMEVGAGDGCVPFDVNWTSPLGFLNELTLFHWTFASQLLNEENQQIFNGIKCLNDLFSLHLAVYNLTINKGIVLSGSKFERLKYFLDKLDVNLEFSDTSLIEYLIENSILPPLDFLRKWAEYNKSPLLKKYTTFCDKENQVICFIFREIFRKNRGLLDECLAIIRKSGFLIYECQVMDFQTRVIVTRHLRGGVWNESEGERVGGGPYAYCLVRGVHASVRALKEELRDFVERQLDVKVNCVHSSDDEFETLEYSSLLGVNLIADS